jgi:probable HAF family extracellular repeat protein
MVDLDAQLGAGGSSEAFAINDRGQVVGTRDGSAFRWSQAAGMRDLGTLPQFGPTYSAAYGIDSAGNVVGMSVGRAFLWTEGSGMRDRRDRRPGVGD